MRNKYSRLWFETVDKKTSNSALKKIFEQHGKVISLYYQPETLDGYLELESSKEANDLLQLSKSEKIHKIITNIEYANVNLNRPRQRSKNISILKREGRCFNCQQIGHIAAQCSQRRAGPGLQDRFSRFDRYDRFDRFDRYDRYDRYERPRNYDRDRYYQGRRYDEKGEVSDWWSQETIDGYDERARCFEEQYDAYVPSQLADQGTTVT